MKHTCVHLHVFIETKAEKRFLRALEKLCKSNAIPFENIKGKRYWTQIEKRWVEAKQDV